MTPRPDPHPDQGGPAPQDAPDHARRALLRGAALLGFAGMTGTLSACGGGGSTVTSAAGPPADPAAPAPAAPAKDLPTKSQVYKRAPEPRTRKAKAAADAAEPTDVPGPPPREADLKPGSAKAEARSDAKADAKADGKAGAKRGDAPATKPEGAQPAARAPREDKKAAKPAAQPAATAKPTPVPVVAESMDGARTSDIPVGGGRIYAKEKIVVTQPTKDDFKAFSAVCTHQKCLVSTIDAGAIVCLCHGSRFGISDGGVQRGPAFLPLPAEKITVAGGTIKRG